MTRRKRLREAGEFIKKSEEIALQRGLEQESPFLFMRPQEHEHLQPRLTALITGTNTRSFGTGSLKPQSQDGVMNLLIQAKWC